MIFNIHRGQMRRNEVTVAVPNFPGMYNKRIDMRYVPKSPKATLMLHKLTSDGESVRYDADKLGNIEVVAQQHIQVMVGLGFPIYDGNGKTYPVPMDDLLFPSDNLDSSYWRKIAEALNLQKEA